MTPHAFYGSMHMLMTIFTNNGFSFNLSPTVLYIGMFAANVPQHVPKWTPCVKWKWGSLFIPPESTQRANKQFADCAEDYRKKILYGFF